MVWYVDFDIDIGDMTLNQGGTHPWKMDNRVKNIQIQHGIY